MLDKTRSTFSHVNPAIRHFAAMDCAIFSHIAIVKLNTEIVRVINLPDVRKQLADQGYEPAGSTPEQFAEYIRTEIAKWTRVINTAGLKAE